MNKDSAILNKLANGDAVSMMHPDMPKLGDAASVAFKILMKFNNEPDINLARNLLSEVFGYSIDHTSTVYPPFYTNYGKNIKLGKNVFINHACSFLDLGGIEIGDDVMIGPRVNITSETHPVQANIRKTLVPAKVTINKNVWIGAGATILPGVIVGEHSVVAAGAMVTKDVPSNSVVAGVPARIVKQNI